MKTLLNPIPTSTQLLNDSSEVALSNSLFTEEYDLSNHPLQEGANSFMVSIPVPGLSKDDLNIQINGRLLVISTKAHAKFSENGQVSERRNNNHAFIVPAGVDVNRIQAKCRHGLLTIKIEKIKNKKRPIVIKVEGKENHSNNSRLLNDWWEWAKEKLNFQKWIQRKLKVKFAGN